MYDAVRSGQGNPSRPSGPWDGHPTCEAQLIDVTLVDGARVGKGLPVDDVLPVLFAKEHYGKLRLHLA
eukprot:scaffold88678_cov31-Tisochrysis_lutea.AAC.4